MKGRSRSKLATIGERALNPMVSNNKEDMFSRELFFKKTKLATPYKSTEKERNLGNWRTVDKNQPGSNSLIKGIYGEQVQQSRESLKSLEKHMTMQYGEDILSSQSLQKNNGKQYKISTRGGGSGVYKPMTIDNHRKYYGDPSDQSTTTIYNNKPARGNSTSNSRSQHPVEINRRIEQRDTKVTKLRKDWEQRTQSAKPTESTLRRPSLEVSHCRMNQAHCEKDIAVIHFEGVIGFRCPKIPKNSMNNRDKQPGSALGSCSYIFSSSYLSFIKSLYPYYNTIIVFSSISNDAEQVEMMEEVWVWCSEYLSAQFSVVDRSPSSAGANNISTLDFSKVLGENLMDRLHSRDNVKTYFIYPFEHDISYLKAKNRKKGNSAPLEVESDGFLNSIKWVPKNIGLGGEIHLIFFEDLRRGVLNGEGIERKQASSIGHIKHEYVSIAQDMSDLAEGNLPVGAYWVFPDSIENLINNLRFDWTGRVSEFIKKKTRGERKSTMNMVGGKDSSATDFLSFKQRYFSKVDQVRLKEETYASCSDLIKSNMKIHSKMKDTNCEGIHSMHFERLSEVPPTCYNCVMNDPLLRFIIDTLDKTYLTD